MECQRRHAWRQRERPSRSSICLAARRVWSGTNRLAGSRYYFQSCLREANVKQRSDFSRQIRFSARVLLVLAAASLALWSQQPPPADSASAGDATTAAVRDLQEQVRQLRDAVAEIRAESAQYRAETAELRHELEQARSQPQVAATPAAPAATEQAAQPPQPSSASSLDDRVANLEDTTRLLSAKVDDQYQTKVESASKYRLRLSGIVLMNLFSNRGVTDNHDVPNWATGAAPGDPQGNFGATLRQSELGLEAFGPEVAGARTSADLQLDFSGGFPQTYNGVNFGVVRLRIASMRLDWKDTSIVAGQDNLFISPLSPTSFASLSTPSFGYAGNLWAWTPQVRAEHRFEVGEGQTITVQGGILDNLTGNLPDYPYDRSPQAGEASSQPAFASRIAWSRNVFGQPLSFGAAGYYSRQNWGFGHHIDGWAGLADLQIPVAPKLALSGEVYRGRAIGGLGGGIGQTILSSGAPDYTVTGLDSVGGWAQLKFRATSKLEFNGAFGQDNPFASDVRAFSGTTGYSPFTLVRNRGSFVNFIYRPRSNLLFSAEYRHLRTFDISNESWTADQVNLMMGVLF